MSDDTYYIVLGLAETATQGEIERRRREFIAAYLVLSDSALRSSYDELLARQRQQRAFAVSPSRSVHEWGHQDLEVEGVHVRVGPTRPDGRPHPHAGKTGRITRFIHLYSDPYWLGRPSAMIQLDPGIRLGGFIWVSTECLEVLSEHRLGGQWRSFLMSNSLFSLRKRVH
jgi:curved DNA-binding protein CbpA